MAFIMSSSAHNSNKKRDFIPVSDTLIGPANRAEISFSASDKESAWRWKNAALKRDQLCRKLLNFVPFDKCYCVPSALKPHISSAPHGVRLSEMKTESRKCCSAWVRCSTQAGFSVVHDSKHTYNLQNGLLFCSAGQLDAFPLFWKFFSKHIFSFDTSPSLWKSSCLLHVSSLSSSAASFDPGGGGCGTPVWRLSGCILPHKTLKIKFKNKQRHIDLDSDLFLSESTEQEDLCGGGRDGAACCSSEQ